MIFGAWNPIGYGDMSQAELNRQWAQHQQAGMAALYAEQQRKWKESQGDIIDIAPEDVRFVEDPKLIEAKK